MNDQSSKAGKWLTAAAVVLAIAPGGAALLGTSLQATDFVISNLMFSPFLALGAGLLLGFRTGESTLEKLAHSFLGALGVFGFSLALQYLGCNGVDYRF